MSEAMFPARPVCLKEAKQAADLTTIQLGPQREQLQSADSMLWNAAIRLVERQ